ncbi:putative bifunctional diguanylate cyclase/phosphodiesterase [Undibacterium arcticum]
MIGLLWRFKPRSLDLRLELLQWLALALTLPWFALMGGFISGLRKQLHKSNKELQAVLQRVQASEASLAQAQRIAGLGSWTLDRARRSATWSLETYRLFGVDPAQPTLTGERFVRLVHPEDRLHYNELIQTALREGLDFDDQFRIVLPNGEIRWLHALGQPDVDADGNATLLRGTVMDITKRKVAEDEIRQLAFYDPLTRLPNRRLLTDRLHHALAASTRSKRHGALLFIDLDNFKTINDTLGHDKGDLLLQLVAKRLSSCVRVADTVARQGGDEFVIMLMDLSEVPEEAAVQTEVIGENILAALSRPYQVAGHVYHNTASIGATLFDGHLESTNELLKRADLSMYQAKAAGRNVLRFFEEDMQATVTLRAEMETALRQGLQDGQFLLYYQAQIDDAGCVTGAEALVRWQHPVRGLVCPAEFIPPAEVTGLILPLGRWVLETACAQLTAWSSRPATAHLTMAVNVSARQFRQPDFVKQVVELLDRTGANARKLKLELTESMLLDNMEEIIAKMSALKALGVGFSLDDFGTGYSSLSYLKRLPLDQLKIDQSFVRDVLTDPNDAAIVRTIVALAQSLGLSVIAEGVETEPQRDFLARNGCNAYQGYLYSRPLPPEQFESLNLIGVRSKGLSDLNIHVSPEIIEPALIGPSPIS